MMPQCSRSIIDNMMWQVASHPRLRPSHDVNCEQQTKKLNQGNLMRFFYCWIGFDLIAHGWIVELKQFSKNPEKFIFLFHI